MKTAIDINAKQKEKKNHKVVLRPTRKIKLILLKVNEMFCFYFCLRTNYDILNNSLDFDIVTPWLIIASPNSHSSRLPKRVISVALLAIVGEYQRLR